MKEVEKELDLIEKKYRLNTLPMMSAKYNFYWLSPISLLVRNRKLIPFMKSCMSRHARKYRKNNKPITSILYSEIIRLTFVLPRKDQTENCLYFLQTTRRRISEQQYFHYGNVIVKSLNKTILQ